MFWAVVVVVEGGRVWNKGYLAEKNKVLGK
jgi:hypothetical protein